MIDLRVLGIGSPFGSDQLGWEVVKSLQQNKELKPYQPKRLELACHDRPGMRLLELMHDAKTVFIIDAIKSNAPVGSLHCFENEELERINDLTSSHAIGISEAIEMGKVLNYLPTRLKFYGIEIDDLRLQFELPETIKSAIERLTADLVNDILFSLKH